MGDTSSRWRSLVIGLLVLIVLGAMFATARPRPELSPVEEAVRDALAPAETLLASAARTVRAAADSWRTTRALREENERLRQEVRSLQIRNHMLEEAWRENRALRSVLGLVEREGERAVPALVVGRPVSGWWSQVTINRGRRHGVEPRQPVVTGDGAVGRVLAVTDTTAEVLLLVDPKSAVGGVVRRTSDPVVVEGVPGGRLRLRALVADADLVPGDLIVTAGFSQLFPSGLPIGRVTAVLPAAAGRSAEAWVEPAVDLSRLEVVAVLTNGEGAASGAGASGGAGSPDGDGADGRDGSLPGHHSRDGDGSP